MNLLTVPQIIHLLDLTRDQIAALKEQEAGYEQALLSKVKDEAEAQLSKNDYGCGTATVNTDGYELKVVVGKKVTYDQEGLGTVYHRILEAGNDPSEYMKVKYDVSETAYKNWPSNIRAAFEPYRSVEPSKPKVTYKKVEA